MLTFKLRKLASATKAANKTVTVGKSMKNYIGKCMAVIFKIQVLR